MKKSLLCTCVLLCTSALWLHICSQGVKISTNPGNPHPSAMLEIGDSTKGFLLPRLTTVQRNAIVNPAVGLQVYNITTQCVETYFTVGWKSTVCECDFPPPQPGIISGQAGFCQGQQGVQYSIAPVPGATSYTWTVPPGATIASGQGTTTITVNYTSGSGNISVTADNTCGTSSQEQLLVSMSQPSAAFGPSAGAIGAPVNFVPQPGYASYNWTFQGGSPAISSQQNPQVTWNSAGSYTVSLTVTDVYGCTHTVTQQVLIQACTPTGTITFTNCGATGRLGPDQNQCDATYGPGVVTSIGGIQQWIVPNTMCPNTTVTIEVWGAQGGHNTNGGRGAYLRGDFVVNPGDDIRMLVGQQGTYGGGCGDPGGGGGGGTFVVRYVNGNPTPLIVAGGGAGGNSSFAGAQGDATLSVNPAGGTGGSCGNGPAAGGYSGNGTASCGGTAFLNGGIGGTNAGSDGGFGGGAGGPNECGSSADLASAGGYQGGNGTGGGSTSYGGLSYNVGTNQTSQSGNRYGHGQVTISW